MKRTAELLRAQGLRATPQRIAALQWLRARRAHITPQQLRAALCARFPTLSLNTAYQMLAQFADAGFVQPIAIGGRVWFDTNTRPHAHLFCTRCRRIVDAESPKLSPPSAEGWRFSAFVLIWEGLCPQCR